MHEPRAKKRRSYLNDFTKNAAGEYIYSGAHYRWTAGQQGRAAILRRLWMLAVAAALCVVICGLMPGTGLDGTAYVLLPYIVEFCAVVNLIWLLARLSRAGLRVRAYVYEQTAQKLSGRGIFTAACAGVVFAGECLRMLLAHGAQSASRECLLLVLQAVLLMLTVVFSRNTAEIGWDCEQ